MGTAREELSGSRTTHRGPAAWPPVHAQSSEEGCPLCRGPWLQERSQVPWAKSATFSVPQREAVLHSVNHLSESAVGDRHRRDPASPQKLPQMPVRHDQIYH